MGVMACEKCTEEDSNLALVASLKLHLHIYDFNKIVRMPRETETLRP